ncbi:hypothetical protein C3L33_09382, partial [Rhododendron williamsianum]
MPWRTAPHFSTTRRTRGAERGRVRAWEKDKERDVMAKRRLLQNVEAFSEAERKCTPPSGLQKPRNFAPSHPRQPIPPPPSPSTTARHIDELLDRHVVKNEKTRDDEEADLLTRQRLTSTRCEVLSLYRDILRATRFFVWADSRGVLWRDVLRENARKEFEAARFERDPEIVTRLLIGGRDAVQSALDKLAEKQREQIDKQKGDRNRR